MSTAARSGRLAAADRASGPRRRAAAWAGASALLYATTADAGGRAAALLELDGAGATILGRLLEQLDGLGVRRAWIVTRPAWADGVRREAADGPLPVEVVAAADVADDLRIAADVAGAAGDRLIVGRADVLAHREALAGLLADPRVTTGVLATTSWRRGRWAYRTRSSRGRMLSASSPFHSIRRPSGYFLGFLKVDRRDLATLRAAAVRLAELADGPERARFEEELARKVVIWRRRQWQLAHERATGAWPEPEEIPLDPPLDPEAETEVAERFRATRDDAGAMLRRRARALGRPRLEQLPAQLLLRAAALARGDRGGAHRAARARRGRRPPRRRRQGRRRLLHDLLRQPLLEAHRALARRAAGGRRTSVTTVSMAIGVAAAAAFATGSRAGLVAGAVLLQAAFTIDCVDGQLARYSRQFSKLGAWLDSIFDRGKEYLVYAGLALGSTRGFGVDVWTLAAATIALQTSRHMVDFSYAAGRHEAIAALPLRDLAEPDERDGPPPGAEADAEAAAEAEAAEGNVAAVEPAAPERAGLRAVAARGVRFITRLEKRPATRWAKRIVALPIGERFALISLTAALWSPARRSSRCWPGAASPPATASAGRDPAVRGPMSAACRASTATTGRWRRGSGACAAVSPSGSARSP